MKIITTLVLLALVLYGLRVFAGDKNAAKAGQLYEFPAEMGLPVQKQFLVLCEKGRILYEMSCSKCHNTKVKGKNVVPDFTIEQLGAYSIRVANKQHEVNVAEETVSAEELALITTYLTYKKKNSVK